MKYSYYDFGNLEKGQIIEVKLSKAANVRLMNNINYNNFKKGRRHNYYGGYVTRSPYRLKIPNFGHWYLTIDLGGYSGSVRHSAIVLPGMLPKVKDYIPLSAEPNLYVVPISENKKYDIFISHASEDKEIVKPLVNILKEKGITVWYDEFELKIGDSLRKKIDYGVSNSRFGVVVISESFIKKGWTNYELDGLVTKSILGQQVILPIWHNISEKEVVDFSPSLANKVARDTSKTSIDEIANEIAELILE